jgi:hypothetical protein
MPRLRRRPVRELRHALTHTELFTFNHGGPPFHQMTEDELRFVYQMNRAAFLAYGDDAPLHCDAFWRWEDADIPDELREREIDHRPEYRYLLGEGRAALDRFNQEKATYQAWLDARRQWLAEHPGYLAGE